ncbi:MAG: glycosyltransferase family 39 protein [Anaerolineales bacterium]|nr:glycosyltransferase family 39 protein [Anaerolineales bacterium]
MVDHDGNGKPDSKAELPSVLDWFFSVLRFKPIPVPEEELAAESGESPAVSYRSLEQLPSVEITKPAEFSWRSTVFPLAVVLLLLAQLLLERSDQTGFLALLPLSVSVSLIVLLFRRDELSLPSFPKANSARPEPTVDLILISAAVPLAVLTYLLSGGNRFSLLSLLSWGGSILLFVLAFWPVRIQVHPLVLKIKNILSQPEIILRIRKGSLLLALAFGIGLFFRFYRLDTVPIEMWSDQAEKLLDVADVLDGQYSIFFVRNTGREAVQFYLSAAVAQILGTGISFLTLKIGTALLGFLTLPFLYLLAKEAAGRRVALFTLILGGIAYWPNVISRAGLRFPLYPFFAAPAMYFLVRGLRKRSVRDFLLSGLAIGFGLHGYSPARIIPVVILLGVLVYILHRESVGWRRQALTLLIVAGLLALIVFIPLLRVAVDMPESFLFRTLSRIAEVERDLPGNPFEIFFRNMWDALRMFNQDNGEIWILGPTHRPAFDWITAAFFLLGVVLTVLRYIRAGKWIDLYLLFSIPVLLLPSALSLAFPSENPALNRASGAMIPALIMAGIAFSSLYEWAARTFTRFKLLHFLLPAVLILAAAKVNYDLVFTDYAEQMERAVWNTADAGKILKAFNETTGSVETGHVVAYPHWMDTRLVGIHSGQPRKDYAIWPDELDSLAGETRPQLFLVNPNDIEGLGRLEELFPDGNVSLWESPIEGHDFLIYSVP